MKRVLIASLLSSLFAAPVFAAAPGPYVALDAQLWNATNSSPFGSPSVGPRIGAGYRFTQNWGAEIDYAQSGNSSTVNNASYKVSALQVAATGTYPLNDQFDVFAKVGLSNNKLSTSNYHLASSSKTDILWGVGGQFNINHNWGIRLQYEGLGKGTGSGNAAGSDFTLATTSLGAVYTF